MREKGDTYLDRLQKTTNKVGPGMYSPLDPRTFQSKKVSGGTIRPRHELKNKEVRPAPNAYLPLLQSSEKSSHVFVADRDPFQPSSDQKTNPGPARYKVKTEIVDKKAPGSFFPV